MLTNQEGVEAGLTKIPKIGVSAETGFGYRQAIVGDVIDQFVGGFHTHGEAFQIAIVDAQDAGTGCEGAIELGARVNLEQRFHTEFTAQSDEIAKEHVIERGDDQQEAVGIIGARFPDLPYIEDEIFTKSRKRDFFAGVAKILQGTVKEFTFRENRERGGSGRVERFGESRRVKRIADDAARR